GVEPGGGLVEKQHFRAAHEAGRQIEAATHPTGVGLHEAIARFDEIEPFQQLLGTPAGLALGQVVEAPDHLEVEASVEQAVDGGLLAGDADATTHGGRRGRDVEAGHRGPTFGGLRQRGEDTDRRRLAGAVVAEQAEHGPRPHLEVQVAQGPQVAEALAEALDHDAPGSPVRRRRMMYCLLVHSTTNISSTLYDMAREKSRGTPGRRRGRATDDLRDMVEITTDELRQLAVDAATEKIALKAARQAERVKAKAARHAAQLDRLAAHLEALDVWTRVEPSRRRPRLSREEIAATAVRLADAEGLDALSMRRLAAELGAGTMTLYYYVRTKDELLALVTDA